MPTAHWKRSVELALVGFGGPAGAALRQLARLPGRLLQATQRTDTP
jgi:hypothetical protein